MRKRQCKVLFLIMYTIYKPESFIAVYIWKTQVHISYPKFWKKFAKIGNLSSISRFINKTIEFKESILQQKNRY